VNTDEDAEDILQDVWYQLICIVDTEPIDQISKWLYRVSINKIIDRSRKQKHMLLDDMVSYDEEGDIVFDGALLSDETNSQTDIDKTAFRERFQKSIDELPIRQREVFIWNVIENKTLQDIAQITGENIKTIISRKRYAVMHLRERLKEYKYQ
jgi:RNA polymerase sigma factor (sigma-70 family)